MSETSQATHEINANHNPLVDMKEFTFGFRKTTDAETGVTSKRDSVVTKLAIPSVEGLVAILNNGGKGLDLLLSAAENVITDYAKSLLADDPKITSETFPVDSVLWDTIANLPDTDRRGRGIPKEVWEDFIKSYIEIMPQVTGKSVDVIKKQASILAQKFQPLKNHEKKADLLPKFVEMLSLYVNGAPDAEQFQAPIEFLMKKAEQFLNEDQQTDLAENLGFE